MIKSNVLIFALLLSALCHAQLLNFSVYEKDMETVTCQSHVNTPHSRGEIVNLLKSQGVVARSLLAFPAFDEEHLMDIYLATQLIPKSMNLFSNSDWKDIRVIYRPNLNAVANAYIAIGPKWFEFSSLHRRAIILHELFHRLSTRINDLSYSDRWIEASQSWISARWTRPRWHLEATGEENFVSIYAMTNPSEDFAETVNQYRVNPYKLLSSLPIKYKFIKEHVFLGQEFLNNSDCEFDPLLEQQQIIKSLVINFVIKNRKEVRKQIRESSNLKDALLELLNKNYLVKLFLEKTNSLDFLESTWAARYL